MYFGRRHSAKVTLREVLEFTCKRCHYTSPAAVVGSGSGEGNSPFLLDESGAAERAMSAAEENARNNLLDALRFATCPKCRARDVGAIRLAQLKVGFGMAFVVALVLGGTWLFAWGNPWLRAAIAVAAAGLTYGVSRRRWTTADDRVLFPPVRARPAKPSLPVQPSPPRLESDPFRTPPSAPIVVVETAKPLAPAPVVPGDPTNQPAFLK